MVKLCRDTVRPLVGSLCALMGCCFGTQSANAADLNFSCAIEDPVSHSHRTVDFALNERAQYVSINGRTAIADISAKQIAFRVDLSDGAPLDYLVDRESGSIKISTHSVSGQPRVLYSGQCTAAASK